MANMDFCYFKMCRQGYPIPSIKSFNVNPSQLEGFGYKKKLLIRTANNGFCYFKMFRQGYVIPLPSAVFRSSFPVNRPQSTLTREVQLQTFNF